MPRKAFLLRLEPALHDALQRWAEEELRSLNGQIEYLLRQAVARRSTKAVSDEPQEQPPASSGEQL